jgi:hypothetical protein
MTFTFKNMHQFFNEINSHLLYTLFFEQGHLSAGGAMDISGSLPNTFLAKALFLFFKHFFFPLAHEPQQAFFI